jgi:hypothetical protein
LLKSGSTKYEWGTPSAEEAKVIALQAELNDVKSKNLQISKKLKDKLKDPKKGGKPSDGGGSKKKNQKDTSNKTRQKKDEAWKKVAPKAGEAKTPKFLPTLPPSTQNDGSDRHGS